MTRPTKSTVVAPTRRQVIQSGLAVGERAAARLPLGCLPAWADDAAELGPNAFVRIAPDGAVTVIAKHIEFGQGVYSGLATILAEELDADWESVRVEAAPSDASRYNNLFFGPVQATGGSTAIANSWHAAAPGRGHRAGHVGPGRGGGRLGRAGRRDRPSKRGAVR